MDHVTELLHQTFATFLFCIAATILLIGCRCYEIVLNSSNQILNEEIMYEQYNDIDENIFTKGEIVTLLFNELEYDIEIDGFLISKIENVKENILSYSIPDADYLKTYVYDNNGNITRIMFKRII